MSASNRAARITKLQAALKKHYKPQPDGATRPLLEHVLYASLLQDAPSELADEGMAKCEQEFYDWNEVRVTSVTELAQVLSRLPEPAKAAERLKSNLQAIFEEFYTFDLDHLKKENLGRAVTKFEKMPAMTPFVLSYTIQHGLAGHSIPIDYSAMVVMLVTEIASQPEANTGKVPGLERAIPKNKGIDFSGLLHQCAVALNKNPKDKTARAVIDAVDKGSSKRLDEWLVNKKAAKKRVVKRKTIERAEAEEAAKIEAEMEKLAPTKKGSKKSTTKKAATAAPAVKVDDKAAAEKEKKKAVPKQVAKETPKQASKQAGKQSKKSSATGAKKTTPSKSTKATSATKKVVAKKPAAKKTAAKKPAAKKTPTKSPSKKKSASSASSKKATGSKSTAKKKTAKKADNRKLTKRKPR
jgi:DNA polymerase III gamma/tau subunit